MMKNAVRFGDIVSGHECYPPADIVEGVSPNVFVNGRPVALTTSCERGRYGAMTRPHMCPAVPEGHPDLIEMKEPKTVFVNGLRPARLQDKFVPVGETMPPPCEVKGETAQIITASSNVFFDDR